MSKAKEHTNLLTAIAAVEPGNEVEIAIEGAPGLKLRVTKNGATAWVFRYRNASGGQRRYKLGTFPTTGLGKARSEAKKIAGRVEAGEDPSAQRAAQRVPGATLADVVDEYVKEHREGWRDSTARTYTSAIGTFTAWAAKKKITRAADLTPSTLAAFRAHVVALPRRAKKKGGGRRDVVVTEEKRSAAAVNVELRSVKTMLQALRSAKRLPAIQHSDDVADNLKAVPTSTAKARPLKPAQIKALLTAAEKHDSATFTVTRVEHRGEKEIGTTPRYEPIRPFVLVMLLSGMRLGEALALTWEDVDLEDGMIRVSGETSKGRRDRDVDLDVSPMLADLVTTMRPKDATGRVFAELTENAVADARRRMIDDYGAPAFTWSVHNSRPGKTAPPTLRSTCGCYLTCAPSIYGSASAFMSAARLGHSVEVAQRHYIAAIKVPQSARTIEAAMGLQNVIGSQ